MKKIKHHRQTINIKIIQVPWVKFHLHNIELN